MFRKGHNNLAVLSSKERVRKGKKNSCANRLLDSKEEVLKGNDLFSGCFAICLELGFDTVHLLADLVSLLLNLLFYLVELPEQKHDHQRHDHHDYDHFASLLFNHLFYLVELPE